jgi:hypothetical protein
MSLDSGTVSLRRFYTSKSLPHRSNPIWLEKLKEFSICDTVLEQDMENEGWAILGNELSIDFNEKNTVVGPYIIFSYRCDTHRVAMNIVDLHLKSQLSLDAENSEIVNRQKENEMRDDIIRDLLSQTLPSIEIAGVLVDTHNGVVYYTSGSERLIDKLCLLFLYTFDINLIEATYESSAGRLLDDDDLAASLLAQPGLLLVDNLQLHPDFMDEPNSRMGSSFLTWFFYYLQTSESIWVSEFVEEIYVQIESELSLAGETFGSREVTIKKGDINNCKELVAAFTAGKRISKLRFLFYRGDEDDGLIWTFSMDKKNYALLSLKVPKPEAVDSFGIKIERFDNICEIHDIIDDIYRDYLQLRTSKGWSEIEIDMQKWLEDLDDINNPKRRKHTQEKEIDSKNIEGSISENIKKEPQSNKKLEVSKDKKSEQLDSSTAQNLSKQTSITSSTKTENEVKENITPQTENEINPASDSQVEDEIHQDIEPKLKKPTQPQSNNDSIKTISDNADDELNLEASENSYTISQEELDLNREKEED